MDMDSLSVTVKQSNEKGAYEVSVLNFNCDIHTETVQANVLKSFLRGISIGFCITPFAAYAKNNEAIYKALISLSRGTNEVKLELVNF